MPGFLQADYADEVPAALKDLRGSLASGQLLARIDARPGFSQIPQMFASLFDGRNEGTLMALVDV